MKSVPTSRDFAFSAAAHGVTVALVLIWSRVAPPVRRASPSVFSVSVVTPIRAPATPRAEPAPVAPPVQERSAPARKTPTPAPAPAAPRIERPGPRSEPPPAAESTVTGPLRIDGDDMVPDPYLAHIVSRIGRRWSPPSGPMVRSRRAVLHFRIVRDGSVTGVQVEEPSGSSAFDRAARSAVRRAAPFWRLPPSVGGSHLGVHFEFSLDGEKP